MTEFQLVTRLKPRRTVYVRKAPTTIKRPTMAQAELRLRLAELSRESKLLTVEDVARMVGGEVVELDGRKAVKMPDGRILLKQMAYVKHMLGKYRSPYSRVRVPAWLEDLSKRYFIQIPLKSIIETRLTAR
jgi:hypothetical protein